MLLTKTDFGHRIKLIIGLTLTIKIDYSVWTWVKKISLYFLIYEIHIAIVYLNYFLNTQRSVRGGATRTCNPQCLEKLYGCYR